MTAIDAAPHSSSWLVLAVGENRAFGSNNGYSDVPESHYKWDSTVPNHSKLAPGDPIVLWDKVGSIGMSVIETIDSARTTKTVYSCPGCGKAHIKARKTKSPRYRCFKCLTDFDEPVARKTQVQEYTSRHAVAYVELGGLLSGAVLRSLCESPKSQLSLRPLKWEAFKTAVTTAGGPELLTIVNSSQMMATGGHTTANVRVRLGQASFRRSLIDATGPVCIFTGDAPLAVLEAGHLYSYAKVGEHHEHGGFLMRRDLHRLFDLGLLAVHPKTLTIDVSPTLTEYRMYEDLAGKKLATPAKESQRRWLLEHWREHRADLRHD